jgi:hypothetical protein
MSPAHAQSNHHVSADADGVTRIVESNMTKGMLARLLPPLLLLAAAGCASTGSGYGVSRSGREEASFRWDAKNDVTGTLTATVPGGRTYTGPYFQVTSETRVENLAPLWYGWRPGWRGWRYWEPVPAEGFVTEYTGRVVANLAASDGDRMRCRFHLMHPAEGMAGGGEGECQMPDGEAMHATFPNA